MRIPSWRSLLGALFLAGALVTVQATTNPQGHLLVVAGAPGEEEYRGAFLEQARAWVNVASNAQWHVSTIGVGEAGETNDLWMLREWVMARMPTNSAPMWLVFIGHGTFDGKTARFNLRGPDVTAGELAEWLRPLRSPLVLINTASSSAPFLNQLSGTNRLIVTATRSGHEQNYTRLGKFLAEAISSRAADLDKDEQVSVLEAFLHASRRTAEYYKAEGRILTEHALLDDNGDSLGTPAEWFQGLRPSKMPKDNKAAVDGTFARQQHLVRSDADQRLTAEQIARRNELERSVFELREKKDKMPETQYYAEMERYLIELARIYYP